MITTGELPTVGTNVYNSRDYYKVKHQEEANARKNWEDAQNPIETGVIPRYFNTLHIKQDSEKIPNKDYQSKLIFNVIKHLDPEAQHLIQAKAGAQKAAIHDIDREMEPEWGIVMDRPVESRDPLQQIGGALVPGHEDFTHNNMVPFYRGTITQDTRSDSRAKEGKLELYTGQFKLKHPQKKECGLFFKPTSGLTNVYGFHEQRDLTRYNPNNTGKENNILPFEQVRVGPGLNQGFTATPSGGFHQPLRILPKPVDQLRIDPVLESEGRIKAGKAPVGRRGLVSQVYRNRPELLVENKKGERNFTTVGAVHGRTLRPTTVLRDTHRKKSKFLITPAKAASATKPRVAPKTKRSRRQNFRNTPFRNAASDVKRVNDYGKSGYRARLNNRTVTGCRTHVTSLKGPDAHKKRPYDRARKTRKQHYVHHSRTYGYAGPQKPGNAPAYIPTEWAAKTTIRETTEDNKHIGGAGTTDHQKHIAQVQDQMRTTIRETTENFDHTGNFASTVHQAPAYNPQDWVASTTIRETTEDNKRIGNVGSLRKKHVVQNQDQARTTIRQTTGRTDHLGGVSSSRKKHIAYDPDNYRPRTTIRETTEDNNHLGNVGSLRKKHIVQNQDQARTTIRQTTERTDHLGGVGSSRKKHIVQTQDPVRNTNRQFTSDNGYTGTANASHKKFKSYDDAYNARLNFNKERVAEGREQMGGGPRLGHQEINMEIKKLDSDRVNQYSAVKTNRVCNMYNPKAISRMTVTSERNFLPQHDTRLDTDLLEAYKRNPLTQSLHSWA